MSNFEDDEALFDDIYDDEQTSAKVEDKPTESEHQAETSGPDKEAATSTNDQPQDSNSDQIKLDDSMAALNAIQQPNPNYGQSYDQS